MGTTKIRLFQELYRRSCELFGCGSVPLCGEFKVVFIKSVQTIYGSYVLYQRHKISQKSILLQDQDGAWFSKLCEKNQSYSSIIFH